MDINADLCIKTNFEDVYDHVYSLTWSTLWKRFEVVDSFMSLLVHCYLKILHYWVSNQHVQNISNSFKLIITIYGMEVKINRVSTKNLIENWGLPRTVFLTFHDISFINFGTFLGFFKICIQYQGFPGLFYGLISNGFRTINNNNINDS